MDKRVLLIGLVVLLTGINACKTARTLKTGNATTAQEHNSMNSLDWAGVYKGILPCADCEGIQTMIKLNKDLTYVMETRYLGKSPAIKQLKGTFRFNLQGNTINLDNVDKNARPSSYAVGENTLTQLDMKEGRIMGELAGKYILRK